MSSLVYPVLKGLTLPLGRTPMWGNIIQRTPYGFRTAVQQQQYARIKYELRYNFLRGNVNPPYYPSSPGSVSEIDILLGFFNQLGGAFDTFLFSDPEYHHVEFETLPLISDGAGSPTYYTPLLAKIDQYGAIVTDLNPLNNSGLVVKANGSTTTNFTIQHGATSPQFSFPGLVLKWNAMPTAPITAQFDFYMRCAFPEDSTKFEKFSYIGGKATWRNQAVVFEQEFA